MTGARVQWDGLEELKAWLRTLPQALAADANAIVEAHARMAQQQVQAGYPDVSGNLIGGVRVTWHAQARYGAGAIVKSAAKHAWIYEHGTGARTYTGTDKRGRVFDNAPRGVMPPAPPSRQAIPKFIYWRARMYAQLAAMMERHGLQVSGSIGGATLPRAA